MDWTKVTPETMPHIIDATTSQDINSGRYPVYVLGFGVSEDDLTDDERKLLEKSKRGRDECGIL